MDAGQGQKKVSVVESRWSGEKGGEKDGMRWNVRASTCPWRSPALYLSCALSCTNLRTTGQQHSPGNQAEVLPLTQNLIGLGFQPHVG